MIEASMPSLSVPEPSRQTRRDVLRRTITQAASDPAQARMVHSILERYDLVDEPVARSFIVRYPKRAVPPPDRTQLSPNAISPGQASESAGSAATESVSPVHCCNVHVFYTKRDYLQLPVATPSTSELGAEAAALAAVLLNWRISPMAFDSEAARQARLEQMRQGIRNAQADPARARQLALLLQKNNLLQTQAARAFVSRYSKDMQQSSPSTVRCVCTPPST